MKSIEDNKHGLKPGYMDLISGVFKKYPQIEHVILYGSRAMGNYKPYSDIDISLVGREINLSVQHKIENELDDLLLPYVFDVSVLTHIDNLDLLEHINRVGIQIYSNQ
jgi:predicted nucleotidyltransferase